jgi:hypothetical protein
MDGQIAFSCVAGLLTLLYVVILGISSRKSTMPDAAFLAPVVLVMWGGWNGIRKPTPALYLQHPTQYRETWKV